MLGGPLEEGAWTEALGTPVEGTRAAFLAVPLIAREEVVGVIVVSRSEPPVVRRHEVELLLLYANTAGLTVERAELYTRMHRSLEQLEVTDHVSHLLTLGAGGRRAAEAIARCAAAGQAFAGLMVGVDGFAEYNDRCGRERGDRSLGEVGDLVKAALRADDVALRYGGRLLAVVVPGASREQAAALAQRIARRGARSPLRGPGRAAGPAAHGERRLGALGRRRRGPRRGRSVGVAARPPAPRRGLGRRRGRPRVERGPSRAGERRRRGEPCREK